MLSKKLDMPIHCIILH
jgi:hypothetical protein